MNLWPDDMHTPWLPSSEFYKNKESWFTKDNFIPVLSEYDKQIGRLIEGLERVKLLHNTLIVFTSDNGPDPTFDQIRNNSRRGAKNSLYEAGINVPFIISWPAKIEKGRTNNSTVINAVDLLPSICAIVGVKLPIEYDFSGEDLSQSLTGKLNQIRQKDLMWDFGRNEFFRSPAQPYQKSPHLAIRQGNYKLLVNSDGTGTQLFDLDKDGNETTNMSNRYPEITSKLKEKLLDWYNTKCKKSIEVPIKG